MIKAIETHYNGYHFRSRLEARWAVFFDAVDLKYEYEVEGFDLGDGIWYLPDFSTHWPTGRVWVEIKSGMPSDEEIKKCILLSSILGERVLLLCGSPGVPKFRDVEGNWILKDGYFGLSFNPLLSEKSDEQAHNLYEAGFIVWKSKKENSKIAHCDRVLRAFSGDGLVFDWWPIYLRYKELSEQRVVFPKTDCIPLSDGTGNHVSPYFPGGFTMRGYIGDGRDFKTKFILDAYKKARGARFEFGETPT